MNTSSHTLLALLAAAVLLAASGQAGIALGAGPAANPGAPASTVPSATPGVSGSEAEGPGTTQTSPPPNSPSNAPGPATGQLATAITVRITGPSAAKVGKPTRWLAIAGSPEGPVVYRWDFTGDGHYGAPAPAASVTHVFTRAGTVEIGVLAVDAQGDQATAVQRVVVRGAARRAGDRSTGRLRSKHGDTARARTATGASVTIKDFSFGPPAITIHTGDTVTWVNEGPSNHTATAAGVFNTGILRAGQSTSETFPRAGTFQYRCSIHPFMRGSVTVLPASSAGAAPETGSKQPSAGRGAPSTGGSAQIPSGPSLPNTGFDTRAEFAAGLAMLALGTCILLVSGRRRRRSAPPHE